MQVLYPDGIGIWSVSFFEGRKTGEPGEKPSEKGENQQQTQPTYDTRLELNPGLIGGRRVLSKLAVPASLVRFFRFVRTWYPPIESVNVASCGRLLVYTELI